MKAFEQQASCLIHFMKWQQHPQQAAGPRRGTKGVLLNVQMEARFKNLGELDFLAFVDSQKFNAYPC